MATLVLQAACAFAGSLIGGPFGAIVGQAAGAVAGSVVDQAIFGRGGGRSQGPRLTRLPGIAAAEGAPIARVYGRARTGGTLIWMTRYEETASTTRRGGAGGKGGSTRTTTYSYFGNFAIGICEGPIAEIRRIWADGEEIDQTRFTIRIHNGGEDQSPDPLIVAKEGAQNAPAYRGLAYAVFERMPLDEFGNRIPQFSFEVVNPLAGVNGMVRGVCIIPGSSEFAYQPAGVMGSLGGGISQSENRHVLTRGSDWEASLDSLQAICPNVKSAALVVSWFGDDLRAGQCTITPRTEKTDKLVQGYQWSVAGLKRATAQQVSSYAGKPAYGGTPSDQSVIAAIRDIRDRGLKAVFYPFVMMDIAQDNALPDPWTGAAMQAAYPWRGRIVCDPAPGRPFSPDGTAAAATQVEDFFGSETPAADEWSYRRFILHYAHLCVEAGGVDTFLLGSELVALTRVRSAAGVYPAVAALADLAADVRAILGPSTKISYAADWTEYGAHVRDGGNEVRFPLDALWASPHIDFVGIDAYWPLSDWRDGDGHADAAIARSIYDPDYLHARMNSGEAYDWYYADEAARDLQQRAAIADGAYNKPWIFRQKDIRNWWSNAHVGRIGNVELAAPTAWIAQGKPIRIMEAGCPAIDRGANAPHVFPDPKSSESRIPWFSRGFRDDLMQARFLEAFMCCFDPAIDGHVAANNPISPVYGGPMVDPAHVYLWAWDARPFPAFPQQGSVWADAQAWHTGHWLNGRLEAPTLDRLALALAEDVPSLAGRLSPPQIDAMADGYVIEQPTSPRGAIEPLTSFFGFDLAVTSGDIRMLGRDRRDFIAIDAEELVVRRDGALLQMSRAQESELARQVTVNFHNGEVDYRTSATFARRMNCASDRDVVSDIALVTTRAEAQRRAEILLQDMWAGRETLEFELPHSYMHLEVGDRLALQIAGRSRAFRIERIGDGKTREITARSIEPSIYDHAPVLREIASVPPPAIPGPARIEILDLAIARGEPATLQYVAAFADPWPGRMALWRDIGGASFDFLRYIDRPALIGETLDAFLPGVVGRFDRANVLTIRLARGALSSVSEAMALSGRNAMAIRGSDGQWEMFAFLDAELVGPGTWRIAKLLRGLGGDEGLAKRTLAAGATIVLLDEAVAPLTSELAHAGQEMRYRIGPADRDYSNAAYAEFAATASLLALKPYAPVRARAKRTLAGIEIAFLRRGRVDSDAWEPVNIPLGEESEAYEIDIRAGGIVVRTLSGASSPILYAAGQESADFGSAQVQLDVAIHQLSAIAGRGFSLRDVIPVI